MMHTTPKRRSALLAAGLAALTARLAAGATVSFPDFSDTTGLTLNGVAAAVPTGDGTVLRLVPAAAARSGSVFSSTTVNAAAFSTAFSFRITDPGGLPDSTGEPGADGFVFVVQPLSSSSGGAGSGLGYSGIDPSLGVEFDLFYNGASDTSSNHLGVDLDGNVNSVAALHVSPRWDDGGRWYAWVDYDGTTLEVRANQTGVRPVDPLLSHAVDIPALIGQQDAFVGFTAATGAAWAAPDVIEWTYFDHYNPGGTTTTTSTSTTSSSVSPATSTTTTLPDGDPCGAEPDGPTFRSLGCRLDALLVATLAAEDLDQWRDDLVKALEKAAERNEVARRLCAEGASRLVRARLRQVVRRVRQYTRRLGSRGLRTRVPDGVREPLAEMAGGIEGDARKLQHDVRCPADAS